MVPANVEAPADIDPLFKEMTGALADVKEVTPVLVGSYPPPCSRAAARG